MYLLLVLDDVGKYVKFRHSRAWHSGLLKCQEDETCRDNNVLSFVVRCVGQHAMASFLGTL